MIPNFAVLETQKKSYVWDTISLVKNLPYSSPTLNKTIQLGDKRIFETKNPWIYSPESLTCPMKIMLVFRGEPLETDPRLCLEKMVFAGRNHSLIPGEGGKLASTVVKTGAGEARMETNSKGFVKLGLWASGFINKICIYIYISKEERRA